MLVPRSVEALPLVITVYPALPGIEIEAERVLMPIIVKAGSDFIPAPEGSHIGVLVDVVELGLVSTTYNGKTESKEMVRLV